MTRSTKTKPEAMLERAIRDGEILPHWSRVDSSIWTEPMLTALETGVEGGKWFSISGQMRTSHDVGCIA